MIGRQGVAVVAIAVFRATTGYRFVGAAALAVAKADRYRNALVLRAGVAVIAFWIGFAVAWNASRLLVMPALRILAGIVGAIISIVTLAVLGATARDRIVLTDLQPDIRIVPARIVRAGVAIVAILVQATGSMRLSEGRRGAHGHDGGENAENDDVRQ